MKSILFTNSSLDLAMPKVKEKDRSLMELPGIRLGQLKGKRWTFTLHAEFAPPCMSSLFTPILTFLIAGLETGTSGHEHWQGYFETRDQIRGTALKKMGFPKETHFEKAWKTAEINVHYCTKEKGEFIVRGELAGKSTKPINEVIADLKEDETKEQRKQQSIYDFLMDSDCKVECARQLKKRLFYESSFIDRCLCDVMEGYREKPRVVYIYGPTNKGKTTSVFKVLREHGIRAYAKDPSCSWWEGYDYEPVTVFDEFTGWISLQLFNKLCDGEKMRVQYKGGSCPFVSTIIILISNRPIDRIYPRVKDDRPLEWEAWRRRITKYIEIAEDDSYEYVKQQINLWIENEIHVRRFIVFFSYPDCL